MSRLLVVDEEIQAKFVAAMVKPSRIKSSESREMFESAEVECEGAMLADALFVMQNAKFVIFGSMGSIEVPANAAEAQRMTIPIAFFIEQLLYCP